MFHLFALTFRGNIGLKFPHYPAYAHDALLPGGFCVHRHCSPSALLMAASAASIILPKPGTP
jgi:hypothetical protein